MNLCRKPQRRSRCEGHAVLGAMHASGGALVRVLLLLAVVQLLVSSVPAAPAPTTNTPALSPPPSGPSPPPSGQSPSGSLAATMETLDDIYKLAMGDRVSFRIVEDNEEPRQLMVLQSGGLEIPYIGRFPSLGKTCKTLAHEIKAELEKEFYIKATVVIAVDQMTLSRGRIYLFGAVRAAGPQEIPSDEVFTLSKAIMRAGGFSDFANKRQVKVTRKETGNGDKPKTMVRNIGDVIEKGETKEDLVLEVGDIIYIPSRSVNF